MLSSLNIKTSYRSDQCNIINDFYVPCLSVSKEYCRAVGYFSSSALALAAKGLHAFIKSGGKMKLIASPFLSKKDIDAIKQGYINRKEAENKAIIEALNGEFDTIVRERIGLLAWLVEYDLLDIKIAVLNREGMYGIYHEKLGIFFDGQNYVTFTGSSNESASGLINNFECIDVYCSWKSEDKVRLEEKVTNFKKLWENNTPYLEVYSYPEAAKKSILRFRQEFPPEQDPEIESITTLNLLDKPRKPSNITLRPYQQEAIKNWFNAKGRGTLKMATGSGKTITALSIVSQLSYKIGLQAVIIICPYKHLVYQWKKECQYFGLSPTLCFKSRNKWAEDLSNKLYNLKSEEGHFLSVITTNSTFTSKFFQKFLKYFPEKTLIIGDEAHNLGAPSFFDSLPKNIGLRLALSATPERWFDDSGTKAIFDYFGPVLKPEFTLKDALKAGALVPYFYYPIFVTLSDNEAETYTEISAKIAKAISTNNDNGNDAVLSSLLYQRARIIASAENKLQALKDLMAKRLDTTHTLFYCGDGSVEDAVSLESVKQIEAVTRLLGNELNYKVDTYTAQTPLEERENLRDRFDRGILQGIVAIRCLDEGVDIPSTRTAVILASSSNPRQFIQRRGRVLRPHPSKQFAEIFDMIVLPPNGANINYESERKLIQKEFARIVEFADLAVNAGEIRGKLLQIQKKYGLLSM